MSDTPVYTADQIAEANTAMRTALGLPPEHFSARQVAGMLGSEIAELRAEGWGNEEIATLLTESLGSPFPVEALGG